MQFQIHFLTRRKFAVEIRGDFRARAKVFLIFVLLLHFLSKQVATAPWRSDLNSRSLPLPVLTSKQFTSAY
jgi:hypothetical protein